MSHSPLIFGPIKQVVLVSLFASDDMQGQDGGQEVNSFGRERGKLHNEVTSGASKLLVDSVSAQNSQG